MLFYATVRNVSKFLSLLDFSLFPEEPKIKDKNEPRRHKGAEKRRLQTSGYRKNKR
jgi:hypothetical protein